MLFAMFLMLFWNNYLKPVAYENSKEVNRKSTKFHEKRPQLIAEIVIMLVNIVTRNLLNDILLRPIKGFTLEKILCL